MWNSYTDGLRTIDCTLQRIAANRRDEIEIMRAEHGARAGRSWPGGEHRLRQRQVVRVDVALFRKGHRRRLVVSAFDQPHTDAARSDVLEILARAKQVGL